MIISIWGVCFYVVGEFGCCCWIWLVCGYMVLVLVCCVWFFLYGLWWCGVVVVDCVYFWVLVCFGLVRFVLGLRGLCGGCLVVIGFVCIWFVVRIWWWCCWVWCWCLCGCLCLWWCWCGWCGCWSCVGGCIGRLFWWFGGSCVWCWWCRLCC